MSSIVKLKVQIKVIVGNKNIYFINFLTSPYNSFLSSSSAKSYFIYFIIVKL